MWVAHRVMSGTSAFNAESKARCTGAIPHRSIAWADGHCHSRDEWVDGTCKRTRRERGGVALVRWLAKYGAGPADLARWHGGQTETFENARHQQQIGCVRTRAKGEPTPTPTNIGQWIAPVSSRAATSLLFSMRTCFPVAFKSAANKLAFLIRPARSILIEPNPRSTVASTSPW